MSGVATAWRDDVGDGTSAHAPRHRRARRPLLNGLWTAVDRHPVWTAVAGAAVTAVLFLANLAVAPDVHIDEVFYVLAGQNVASDNAVSWGDAPVFVHPPLYFLTLAGWLTLTGTADADLLPAITAARHLGALFAVLAVILTGAAARAWTGARAPAVRGRVVAVAMLLVAVDPFLLRFGRLVLIEPMALCAALATLLLAWRLRDAAASRYVPLVGVCIGVAVLVKMPVVFLVAAPALAAVLGRDWRHLRRHLAALAVGGVIWASFPLWAAVQGHGGPFAELQTLSLRRLVGAAQVSGLGRSDVSAVDVFLDTFWQFFPGYLVFALGGAALVAGLLRCLRRPAAVDEGSRQVLGFATAAYAFLGYSVLVGQANEQLTVYAIPAAALLAADARHHLVRRGRAAAGRLLVPVAATTVLVAVVAGVTSWTAHFWPTRDDASLAVGRWVEEHYPCTPVNVTGDIYHWAPALPRHPLNDYASGPEALDAGVRLFLLSPKDAELRYGSMSPEFEQWIRANATQVHARPSVTHREISVWVVGSPQPLATSPSPACGTTVPAPSDEARADLFGGLLVAMLAGTAVVAVPADRWARRRSLSAPAWEKTARPEDGS